METQYFYSTEIEWTGERHGDLRAPVLPELHVDAPPEFKGHPGVWTPERLFVAAVNSRFIYDYDSLLTIPESNMV